MSGFIIQLIQSLGYFGVSILMTLESALIPIPSEITLPFAGFLAQKGVFSLPLAILAGVIGDTFGTMILYAIGYFLEETVILKFLDRYGKFFLFSRNEYTKIMQWLSRKGAIIITISKLLPGFRTIIGLPAGLSEIPFYKALFYTLIGSLIWCTLFVYSGFVLGNNWRSIGPYFQKFQLVIIVMLVLGFLWYVNHKLKIVKFKKK
ncbi:MAG: DedA family protein [Candidatus Levyibacteriota bacterium]